MSVDRRGSKKSSGELGLVTEECLWKRTVVRQSYSYSERPVNENENENENAS